MCVQSLGGGDSPEGGNGIPLQYSCLGNPMDRRAWTIVHPVSKESNTKLLGTYYLFHMHLASSSKTKDVYLVTLL